MPHDLLNKEEKLKILHEILESEEFQNKQKFQDLLQYLVHASLNDETVKECSIAVDFFGKDGSFDPSSDSSVRAYISNLRKKLEHFYLTKGRNKPYKLSIPKGHYYVEFIEQKAALLRQEKQKKIPKYLYLIGMIALAIFLAVLINLQFGVHNITQVKNNDAVWSEIFHSKQKTLIVLGDYYFFSYPYKEGRHSYIRDVEINSDSDLENFIKENPEYKGTAIKNYNAYLDEHLPICLSCILPLLIQYRVNYEIKISSDIQVEDLQKYNIIYIGPYKCLNKLSILTPLLNFQYKPQQGSSTLIYKNLETEKDHVYSWLTNPVTNARNDYAMVTKVFGKSHNVFLLFMFEHDFGNLGTVKYFTSHDKLADFNKTVNSKCFETLFEVTGVVRTDFSTDLVHFNKLASDFEISLDIR
ncbi:MAG: hypothetical protein JXQ65_11055 [Candidatus Marinimicrobia bacterium]|nr:hypothetical protein [Candidatus Neomarinimicrobiota bacterium]